MRKSFGRTLPRVQLLGASLAAASLLSSCAISSSSPGSSMLDARRFAKDGVITISRPAPSPQQVSMGEMLAFLPVESRVARNWIQINRAAGTVSLMNNQRTELVVAAEGLQGIEPGRYEVIHKQRNAAWHASDSYFQRRHLAVPPRGAQERFLRGALGEYALFLDIDLPIHSGPVWSDDVGGIRLSDEDLSRLYYTLETGSIVEVK